jgi:hypothetical protein
MVPLEFHEHATGDRILTVRNAEQGRTRQFSLDLG